jgi:hypothetical protein
MGDGTPPVIMSDCVLLGVGDGIAFCAVLFLLAVLTAPDFMRLGGPRGHNQY